MKRITVLGKPAITHPVCAALDHPLFAFGGKRVIKKSLSFGEGFRVRQKKAISATGMALIIGR